MRTAEELRQETSKNVALRVKDYLVQLRTEFESRADEAAARCHSYVLWPSAISILDPSVVQAMVDELSQDPEFSEFEIMVGGRNRNYLKISW